MRTETRIARQIFLLWLTTTFNCVQSGALNYRSTWGLGIVYRTTIPAEGSPHYLLAQRKEEPCSSENRERKGRTGYAFSIINARRRASTSAGPAQLRPSRTPETTHPLRRHNGYAAVYPLVSWV